MNVQGDDSSRETNQGNYLIERDPQNDLFNIGGLHTITESTLGPEHEVFTFDRTNTVTDEGTESQQQPTQFSRDNYDSFNPNNYFEQQQQNFRGPGPTNQHNFMNIEVNPIMMSNTTSSQIISEHVPTTEKKAKGSKTQRDARADAGSKSSRAK